MHISWPSQSRLTIAAIALSLVACGTQHATFVPDGRRGYMVTCGGFFSSWSSCLIKAGRACGNHGYETIKGSDEDRSILIACKVPEIAAVPEPARH